MAGILQLRSSSSSCASFSQSSHSYPFPICFLQCCPPAISLPLPRASRHLGFAAHLVTVTGGFRIVDLRRLCASQHVGGGRILSNAGKDFIPAVPVKNPAGDSCVFERLLDSVERNDAAATGPSVKPEAKLTAEEAVEAQMNALARNDHPRADHGLEVMYHFADSEGALNGGTLPEYFGFPSDLYHFGHFALKFKSRYPELICHNGYEIVNIHGDDEDHCEIMLKLQQAGNDVDSEWVFSLSKSRRGMLPPCWLTSSLLKVRGSA